MDGKENKLEPDAELQNIIELKETEEDQSSIALAAAQATSSSSNIKISFIFNNTANLVEDRFKIIPTQPIAELSNEFGKAYQVEDQKGEGKFYAFIYQNKAAHRYRAIKLLTEFKEGFTIIAPKAAEILPVGEKLRYQLCTIIPYPDEQWQTIQQFIERNGVISEAIVVDKVFISLLRSIITYENLQLSHGFLNHKNIYINEFYEIKFGECIKQPNGFFQSSLFEPIERMLLSPFAKAENDLSADFFALGVIIIYMLTGQLPLAGLGNHELFLNRLNDGTYYSYIKEFSLSSNIKTLLKGLLCDRMQDRWDSRKLIEWHKGRKYNVPVLPFYKNSMRGYSVNRGAQHFNQASLSYELWQDWGQAKQSLKEARLLKWIESSLGLEELSNRLDYIVKMNTINFSSFAIDDDEFIIRSLLILDPETGIKFPSYSIAYEAMPSLISYSFYQNTQELYRILIRLFSGTLLNLFIEIKGNKLKQEAMIISPILEKCKSIFNQSHFGFGLERMLYELNPSMPCQSVLVVDYYCNSLQRLLLSLEKMVLKNDISTLDRHIVGFICAKIDARKDLGVYSSGRMSEIENNYVIKNLIILVNAQNATAVKSLPNIAKKYVEYITVVIDKLYRSRSLKHNITKMLNHNYSEGNLKTLLEIATDINNITKDRLGNQMALRRFKMLEDMIHKNNHIKNIFASGHSYGLKLGMLFAYVVCIIIIFYSISTTLV
ncbi:protein kinase family protein [Rickettsiales endosymbiont of Stachyamoeba lipophora]|uniref:hypothetical protein n=1 Tax=Rickettsiales endosymbiont of Stachyamoeba lipophora TaxID=2486578 RepID=UPI000F6476B0|nr:hypothetical protein [Rickettsiales endosymbiont of Stachyamoeba lipophora]AZL15333.1 hypothetical protein EF513_02015 [Rickettsiales endosymbiont of Stachyamoeba lipophora]